MAAQNLFNIEKQENPAISVLRDSRAFSKRLSFGEVEALEELQAMHERIKASEALIKAYYSSQTIKQLCPRLGRLPSGYTKGQFVDSLYNEVLRSCLLGSFTMILDYGSDRVSYSESMSRAISAYTAQDLAAYNARQKDKLAKHQKALANPETLEEFRTFVEYKGEDALSSEQKIRRDDLLVEISQAKKAMELAKRAEIQAVQLEGVTMSMIESRHTKKNVPLWVVQISDRVERETYNDLNRKAKMLGGWWSSFNKAAIGFQFYEKDQAEKFMGLQSGSVSRLDHLLDKEEAKKDNAAARLHEVAANLEEAASEKLNQDRKTNTARRANMAASAEASASADLALAETLVNLAAAIETGEAKHLSGIKYKTHVETLNLLVRRANQKAGEKEGLAWDKIRERVCKIEDIEHVEYPYPVIWKDHLLKTAQYLSDKKGAMRLAQKMKKYMTAQKEDRVPFRYAPAIAELKAVLSHCKDHYSNKWDYQYLADALEDYNRVQDMGLSSAPELRAALREFLQFRGKVAKPDPIKAKERELIGCKIPGYFPTPAAVIDRMMDLADIQDGMSVLEPSAGKGSIAEVIRALVPSADLWTVEINHSLREILEMKGFTVCGPGDFLTGFSASPSFDRVVMNPPFENFQDVAHVQHAYHCLKPGGRLIAIMSESPFFRSDAVAVAFRYWLDNVGGVAEELPQGSFLESDRSTGVNTRIVVIDK